MLITNYITSAWRNILRHKLFSIINILGLAIGLAAVMLIALYVRYETSYDTFWKNADNIYRVHMEFKFPGEDPDHNVEISGPIVKALQKDFPQIEYASRIRDIERSIIINNENHVENIAMVDSDILNILDFKILAGNAVSALNDENSILLNQSFAQKYFPNVDPIGEIVTIVLDKVTRDYKVSAIYQDLPMNSKFTAKAMFKINKQDWTDTFMEIWYVTGNQSYFKLREGTKIEDIDSQLKKFVDRHFPPLPIGNGELTPSDIVTLSTMNLKNLHLDAKGFGERTRRGDRSTVNLFTLIAILILLIASINYTNLSSARSTQRSREVSMRKVLGANRKQLVFQFISESILLTFFGLFLALTIVETTLPYINNWLENNYALEYFSLDSFYIILLTIFVGVLGGTYPAFVLSKYRPATVLKANKSTENKSTITFRSILVIAQFTISITLFVSTAVVYKQIQFTTDLDLGYKKENLLTIHGNNYKKINESGNILKERIRKLDQVVDLAWTGNFYPGSDGSNSTAIRLENSDNILSVGSRFISYNFLKTLQIPLIVGRDYDINRNDQRPTIEALQNGTANTGSIIINRSALNHLGLGYPSEAIGKKIYRDRSDDSNQKLEAEFQIVGVIDDIKLRSLKVLVAPEIYRLNPDAKHFLNIRYSGDPFKLLDELKQIWNQEIPDVAFYYEITEETLINQNLKEANQMIMFATFSGLAIFIACLGLLGLASFSAERRTKEIGIRKVFGAEVFQIVRMLVFQFSKPVLIANVIAWPIAYLAMSRWLESFVYRIDDMVIIALCLIAGLTALLIAWATVAGNSYAVARQNPIKALRYE